MRRVRRALSERAALVHPSLQPSSYVMLAHLIEAGPRRSSDIAEAFDLDKGAVSRQVQHLVELGLVERTPDPADGRATILTATTEARGPGRPGQPAPDRAARRPARRLDRRGPRRAGLPLLPLQRDARRALTARRPTHGPARSRSRGGPSSVGARSAGSASQTQVSGGSTSVDRAAAREHPARGQRDRGGAAVEQDAEVAAVQLQHVAGGRGEGDLVTAPAARASRRAASAAR